MTNELILESFIEAAIASKNAVTVHGNIFNGVTVQISGLDSDAISILIPGETREKRLKAIVRKDDVVVIVDNDIKFDEFVNKSFEAKDEAIAKQKAQDDDLRSRVEEAEANAKNSVEPEVAKNVVT